MTHMVDLAVINAGLKAYLPTLILCFLAALLLLGKVFYRLLFSRRSCFIVFPPILISGFIGCIVFLWIDAFDHDLIDDISNGVNVMKRNLINFVFVSFILGIHRNNNILPFRGLIMSIFHEGIPMIIYFQILIWGQSMCCIILIYFFKVFFNLEVPLLYAAVIPLGLEVGTDSVGYNDKNNKLFPILVEETESLGLLVICIVLVLILSAKSCLVARGLLHRDNSSYLNDSINPAVENFEIRSNIGSVKNRRLSSPQLSSTVSNDEPPATSRSHSIGSHLSIIFLSIFVSFIIILVLQLIETGLNIENNIISNFPLFKLAMFIAYVGIHLLGNRVRFQQDYFMRFCGLALDVLMVISLTNSNPRPHTIDEETHYSLVICFVMTCVFWNVFIFKLLCKNFFPNYYFERGIILSADALGHSYTGLFFLRILDPKCDTPIVTAYAFKLMLFFIPSSREKNHIVICLLDNYHPILAITICGLIVYVWYCIYESYFKTSYIKGENESDGDSNGIRSPNAFGSKAKADENEQTNLLSLSFDANDVDPTRADSSPTSPIIHRNVPRLVDDKERSLIISREQMGIIHNWLPSSCNLYSWKLSFSLRRDGANMDTIFALLHQTGAVESCGLIILIEDSWNYKFGGVLVNHTLQHNSKSYYGNGEDFVFSISPKTCKVLAMRPLLTLHSLMHSFLIF